MIKHLKDSKNDKKKDKGRGQLLQMYLQRNEPIEETIKRIEKDFFLASTKKNQTDRVVAKRK